MIYFVPYIILYAPILFLVFPTSSTTHTSQLPGNLILRILGARHWLTFSVLAWGAVQLGMGFVTNWGQLTATRALMGMFEVQRHVHFRSCYCIYSHIIGSVLSCYGFPHLDLVRDHLRPRDFK